MLRDALMNICAVSVLTGVGCAFAGSGRYVKALRLLSALWIISILLETAARCFAGIL